MVMIPILVILPWLVESVKNNTLKQAQVALNENDQHRIHNSFAQEITNLTIFSTDFYW